MASIYGGSKGGLYGGSGSKASGYAATALKLAQQQKPHGDGGILGHIEGIAGNLASDVVNSAEGLPAGIVHMATQSPIKSAKEIYASEAATWSPLLTGDYHKFVHNFYEHPLGPLLDISALIDGGASLAGKVGLAGRFAEGGLRTVKTGDTTAAIGRYSENPWRAAKQKSFDSLTKYRENAPAIGQLKMTLPKSTPLIGESARAARAVKRLGDTNKAQYELIANSYNHAAYKLNKGWKKTAAMLVGDGRSPLERLDNQQQHLETWNNKIGKQHAAVIDQHNAIEQIHNAHILIEKHDPKDARVHAGQAANMQKQMDTLNERAKVLEGQYKDPKSEEFQLNSRALSDPRANKLFHDTQAVHAQLKQLGYEDGTNNVRLQDVLHKVKASKDVRDVLVARDAGKALATADAEIQKLDPVRVETRHYLHHLLDNGAQYLPDQIVQYEHRGFAKLGELKKGKVHPLGFSGIGSVGAKMDAKSYKLLDPLVAHETLEQLHPLVAHTVERSLWHPTGIDNLLKKVKSDHAKTGRADPVYMPDKMMIDPRARARGSKGFGRLQNIKVHKNEGALYMAGLLSNDPLLLSHNFMQHVTVAHAQDMANLLREHAEAHTGPLPKGYVALTKNAISRGYMNEHLDSFVKKMKENLDQGDVPGLVRNFIDHHITKDVGAAGDKGGHMLIVPQKMVDALVPEFHKSSTFVNAMWKKPGSIWKHIILGGRPLPFIVNNVIGNTVMYGLRNNDLASLHALIRGHGEERGFEETQAEHHMTFGHSVAVKAPNKAQKVLNFGYNVASGHEHILKRSTFVVSAKKMKVVQQAARELGGKVRGIRGWSNGTYDPALNDGKTILHAAIEKAEKEHGGVNAAISKHIGDVMGDYSHFSKTEQNIKQVMPFYAWNRHAMRAYYRLMTDKPLTAAMMARVGQRGSQETNKMLGDVPEFMKAYLPAHILKSLGYSDSGHTAVINGAVLNPEATVADTIKSVKALVSGKPQNAASSITGNLSPFVTAPIEAVTGRSLLTGAPIKGNFGSSHGLLGATLASIAVSLPQPKTVAALLPGNIPGSSHPNPDNLSSQFTPTGRPKKAHVDTVSKDWQTNLLNTLFGIPAKSIDIPAAQTWQKSIETKAAAALPHVSKPKVSKKKNGSIY